MPRKKKASTPELTAAGSAGATAIIAPLTVEPTPTLAEVIAAKVMEERDLVGRCVNCGSMQPEHNDNHAYIGPDEAGSWDTWQHYRGIRRQ